MKVGLRKSFKVGFTVGPMVVCAVCLKVSFK